MLWGIGYTITLSVSVHIMSWFILHMNLPILKFKWLPNTSYSCWNTSRLIWMSLSIICIICHDAWQSCDSLHLARTVYTHIYIHVKISMSFWGQMSHNIYVLKQWTFCWVWPFRKRLLSFSTNIWFKYLSHWFNDSLWTVQVMKLLCYQQHFCWCEVICAEYNNQIYWCGRREDMTD